MDVSAHAERTNATAGKLLERIDPIAVPETLLATQLLHQANGTPNTQWEVDFTGK